MAFLSRNSSSSADKSSAVAKNATSQPDSYGSLSDSKSAKANTSPPPPGAAPTTTNNNNSNSAIASIPSASRRLVYAAIFHGKSTLLTEFIADPTTPAKDLAHVVLEKLDLDEDTKVSFVYGNYSIHYITRPRNVPSSAPFGLTYLVVVRSTPTDASGSVNSTDSRRLPFLFLMDLESIFRSKYLGKCVGSNVETVLLETDPSARTIPNDISSSSSSDDNQPAVIRRNIQLDRDVTDLLNRAERGDNDVTGLARQEIDNVRTVMIESVEKVLERGERINLLVSKTDRMNNHAVEFRKRTTSVKKAMWWANVKFKVLLALAALVLMYLAMGFLCGLPFFDRCF